MVRFVFRGGATCVAICICANSARAGGDCPADINSDNSVNSSDLLLVIGSWGHCSGGCPADIAPTGGDGMVALNDLLIVLGDWGGCSPSSCDSSSGCLSAISLWCEDFELGNHSRWTGGYDEPTSCEVNGFNSSRYRTPTRSHKSEVVCSTASSHRGYGGLRFQGNTVLPSFSTSSSGGIDSPHGVVVTQWIWLESGYVFDSTRWLSLMTVTHDCSNNWHGVLTLNIDDNSMRLKPVHVASVAYAPNAPAFPRDQWNRVTTYINYHSGSMHVWQNGTKVCSASFTRPSTRMCQWHFGLYASGPNNDITMYEDDLSIVKLLEPMTNFTLEPRFPTLMSPCGTVY